jgi:soluble lytic murein transglycosylase-like protein
MQRRNYSHANRSNAPGILPFIIIGGFIALALMGMEQPSFGKAPGPEDLAELITRAEKDADFEHFVRAIERVESHGDRHAVSKKGARGRFQIMPATGKKPGLGVRPLRNYSDSEQERFARDYLKALLRKYHGNKKLAAAAYNAGHGTVDRLLEDRQSRLPKETRDYIAKVGREYAAAR